MELPVAGRPRFAIGRVENLNIEAHFNGTPHVLVRVRYLNGYPCRAVALKPVVAVVAQLGELNGHQLERQIGSRRCRLSRWWRRWAGGW